MTGPVAPGRPPAAAESEQLIDEVERTREAVRARGRQALGITGHQDAPPLRQAIRESGAGWYTVTALVVLISVNQFQTAGFTLLAPEISQALGVGVSTIAGLYALNNLALGLATLPIAALTQHRPRRAALSILAAFLVAAGTFFTGFAATAVALGLLIAWEGAASGSVRAVHAPLLFDTYPPGARARLLSTYHAAVWLSLVLGPALVGLLSLLGLTWRGVFLVMGVVMLAAAAFAARLRDPGFGRWDSDRVRAAVHHQAPATPDQPAADQTAADPSAAADQTVAARTAGGPSAAADQVPAAGDGAAAASRLKFFDVFRRLLLIPTVKRLLVAYTVLGMMLAPLVTFMVFYLEERWHLGPVMRSVNGVVSAGVSVPVLLLGGRLIERQFRADPARVPRLAGGLLAGGVLALTLGVAIPVLPLVIALTAVGNAAFAFAIAAAGMTVNSMVPAGMRVHAAAIANIALYGAGGLLGQVFLAGIYTRLGPTVAIMSLAVPGVLAGVVLSTCARTVNADLDILLDEVVEAEEVRALVASGHRLPLLSCRRIDFSYGNLQVLFDVSFTVGEGEMVCLLGTNGAGKSTLLKVISGHGLPSRGGVRFGGADITYLDPLRRVDLGIQHIAGGHGTFGQLTVAENLRAFGHSIGRDRRRVAAGIGATFDAFPRLAERRNQKALTLSGGENQMLALGRALLLRPRLLIIDELSLGLAPKVVGELLAMVRQINAAGTAVVLVEQSVNIALSLVDHAYFMEKGEIRFDGAAADLLQRDDLLRSVFLKGAARVVEG